MSEKGSDASAPPREGLAWALFRTDPTIAALVAEVSDDVIHLQAGGMLIDGERAARAFVTAWDRNEQGKRTECLVRAGAIAFMRAIGRERSEASADVVDGKVYHALRGELDGAERRVRLLEESLNRSNRRVVDLEETLTRAKPRESVPVPPVPPAPCGCKTLFCSGKHSEPDARPLHVGDLVFDSRKDRTRRVIKMARCRMYGSEAVWVVVADGPGSWTDTAKACRHADGAPIDERETLRLLEA